MAQYPCPCVQCRLARLPHTSLPTRAQAWLAQQPPHCFHSDDLIRQHYIAAFGFAVLDQATVQAVRPFAPLIEAGAGTGYWTWELQKAGINIVATDPNPKTRWPNIPTWTPVLPLSGPRRRTPLPPPEPPGLLARPRPALGRPHRPRLPGTSSSSTSAKARTAVPPPPSSSKPSPTAIPSSGPSPSPGSPAKPTISGSTPSTARQSPDRGPTNRRSKPSKQPLKTGPQNGPKKGPSSGLLSPSSRSPKRGLKSPPKHPFSPVFGPQAQNRHLADCRA